jgi:hypothetical protein
VESRKRADALAKQAEACTNHNPRIHAVERCKAARDNAFERYEAARVVKEEKDATAAETKRLLETNAEVYTSAVREAAAESHRASEERLSERRAILAYNRALLTRKQADHAKALSTIAMATAQDKSQAAKQAKEYKIRSSRIAPIPTTLANHTWLHTTRHKYWEKTLSLPPFHVLSMSYKALAVSNSKDPKTLQRNMINFTRNHLCRVFPSTSNASPRNRDPVFPWSLGCQLVASNFHALDENLLVVEGRFRQNGSCGYVRKPSALTRPSSSAAREQRWKVRVLRGSYLPKSDVRVSSYSSAKCISPFVKVAVYDGDNTTTKNERQHVTSVVQSNGMNPAWGENEAYEFVVTKPWVAMLSITVHDKADNGTVDFIGGASIPMSHLRQGYRSVAVFDSSHTRSGAFALASLLVHLVKIDK